MRYDISYLDITESFLERMRHSNSPENWLCEFDESVLEEGERLNVILGVIKWEVEHDCLSGELSDELYLYFEDFSKGKLNDIIDPEEWDDVVNDLTDCFNKAFPNGLEDDS